MSWCPYDFLQQVPKTDLHVHLDGSLRLSTLIELARADGVRLPSYDEAELRRTVFRDSYKNLPEYLEGFQYTVAVMRSAENLERIGYEFAEDNYNEGVRYFEVRFAPQLVASLRAGNRGEDDPSSQKNLSIQQVLTAVNKGLRRATEEANFRRQIHENLTYERVCGLASETLIQCAIKCRDELGVPIVALDVAGAEDGFPNKVHKNAFDIAHENFFCKTVHAGEGFGPESIFQAIRDLHAERIGHGFHLFKYVRKLVKYISDRRVNLEVCLTSNMGTMPDLQLKDHKFRLMLEHGVSVTLNTDNRLVSFTTMTDEIKKALDTFSLTPKQLRELVICGFKRSFFHGPYQLKRRYIRCVMDTYDALAAKYKIAERYDEWRSGCDNTENRLPPPMSPGTAMLRSTAGKAFRKNNDLDEQKIETEGVRGLSC
eukprot:GSChrysophyteH1.ASY1.ANO1.815.1 assembled CDS